MARPNPTWSKRPANQPWNDDERDRLAQVVRDGLMIECAPPLFPGHDFGDILKERLALINAGRVQIAAPL